MKNLLIITACLYQGEHVEAGTTLENVDNQVAAEMVSTGRASEVQVPHEVIGNRDPVTENRDPETGPASPPATKQAKKAAKEVPPAE